MLLQLFIDILTPERSLQLSSQCTVTSMSVWERSGTGIQAASISLLQSGSWGLSGQSSKVSSPSHMAATRMPPGLSQPTWMIWTRRSLPDMWGVVGRKCYEIATIQLQKRWNKASLFASYSITGQFTVTLIVIWGLIYSSYITLLAFLEREGRARVSYQLFAVLAS